ncbi:Reverse transcriptase-like [Sesbania bispinosa]|nr:Reverse transcriptase-like [Sesbania bispinosa]
MAIEYHCWWIPHRHANILSSIFDLLDQDWDVSISFIDKDFNHSADTLAKLGLSSAEIEKVWWSPPMRVILWLLADNV